MVLLTKQKIEIFTFNNWWDPTSISSIYIIINIYIYKQHIYILYIYISSMGSKWFKWCCTYFSCWDSGRYIVSTCFNRFQPTPTRSMIGDHIPQKSARKPAKSYSSKISQKQTLTRRDKQPLDHSTYLLLHLPREFRSLESTRALWLLFNSTFNPSIP